MVPNGWTAGKVSDVIQSIESGVSVNGEDRKLEPNELGVLKVSAVSYGYFNPSACKAINIEEIPRAKINPKKGQVIISRSNTPELVGASAYVDKDYSHLFLPDKLWQTIPKPNQNMKWLSYVLALPSSRYYLSDLATGTSSSMKNITQEAFLSLKLLIPSVQEQQKIAKILSTWDKAIASTEKLIANSEQQKKALMQQLLTGKKRLLDENGNRFSGEWKKTTLGKVSSMSSGGTPLSTISEYYNGNIIWVSIADMTEQGKYITDSIRKLTQLGINNSSARIFPKHTILYAMYASIGECSIATKDVSTSQAILGIQPFDELCYQYLYFYLCSIKEKIKLQGQQGAQSNLNAAMVKSLSITLPSVKEQKTISTVLNNADREIELLKAKLEHLQLEKKALMQQLLTGKRRVVIN